MQTLRTVSRTVWQILATLLPEQCGKIWQQCYQNNVGKSYNNVTRTIWKNLTTMLSSSTNWERSVIVCKSALSVVTFQEQLCVIITMGDVNLVRKCNSVFDSLPDSE